MSFTTIGPIDIEETKVIEFPFSGELGAGETIASVAPIQISVTAGADASPGSRLTGAPVIVGSSVLQRLGGCQSGATYHLRAVATSNTGTVHVVAASIQAVTL